MGKATSPAPPSKGGGPEGATRGWYLRRWRRRPPLRNLSPAPPREVPTPVCPLWPLSFRRRGEGEVALAIRLQPARHPLTLNNRVALPRLRTSDHKKGRERVAPGPVSVVGPTLPAGAADGA